MVRRPPREQNIPGSNPACAGIFSGSSHTSDFKIGTPGATLPGAWRYRVSTGTGWPDVSILWMGEVERLICNFYLSVAARIIVWADPSLRRSRRNGIAAMLNQQIGRMLKTVLYFSLRPEKIRESLKQNGGWFLKSEQFWNFKNAGKVWTFLSAIKVCRKLADGNTTGKMYLANVHCEFIAVNCLRGFQTLQGQLGKISLSFPLFCF